MVRGPLQRLLSVSASEARQVGAEPVLLTAGHSLVVLLRKSGGSKDSGRLGSEVGTRRPHYDEV